MRSMAWFRSDLRTHDHRALSAASAAAGSDGVVGVFLLAPVQWRGDWGGVKVRFILRTLRGCQPRWRDEHPTGGGTGGHVCGCAETLARIAASVKCGAVYCSREYEINEQRRDAAVERGWRGMA